MEPRIAKWIYVERRDRKAVLTIDGEPFPYAIARESVRVSVDPDGAPRVTLAILADRVEVLDEWDRTTNNTPEDRA